MQQKIKKQFFCFSDTCIWICIIKLSLLWMICYNLMNIVLVRCLPCFVFVCVGLCFVILPFFSRLALFWLRTEKAVLDTKQRFSRISVELSVTQLNSVTRVKSSLKFVGLVYLFVGNLLTCVNIGYIVSTSFCVIFECIWCQT